MLRFIRSILLSASIIGAATTLKAEDFDGSIFAIEQYRSFERSYITEPYDIFCLQRPGFMIQVPWDASQFYGKTTKGQIEVELIDMGMIECKHGWDLNQIGNRRQGSGGTEWVAIYKDQYLVRFSAIQATVHYSTNGEPSIKALVHPTYCKSEEVRCEIYMKLPMN